MRCVCVALVIGLAAWPAAQGEPKGLRKVVGRIDAVAGQVIRGLHITNPVGPCIVVPRGVQDVVIQDNEIGPCGNASRAIRDYGVFVLEGAARIVVAHNTIHDASSGLAAFGARHPIVFEHNVVYNLRGPAWAGQIVQFNGVRGGTGRSRISCNVFDGLIDTPVSGPNHVGDHISIYASSGSRDDPIEIAYNRIRGAARGAQESGSGIQLGDSPAGGGAQGEFDAGGWIWAHHNTIVRTQGVGIGVAGGSNILVEHNRVENRGEDLASMTGWPYAAVAHASGAQIVFRHNAGTARLWAFNRDGSAGNGLLQDAKRRFPSLREEANRYGDSAGLTPAIFNETPPECQ